MIQRGIERERRDSERRRLSWRENYPMRKLKREERDNEMERE